MTDPSMECIKSLFIIALVLLVWIGIPAWIGTKNGIRQRDQRHQREIDDFQNKNKPKN